jgi:mRNA interferase MazF
MLYHLYAPRWARMASLAATPGTGLKVPSVVGFDKLATLDRGVIAGKIGDAPAE